MIYQWILVVWIAKGPQYYPVISQMPDFDTCLRVGKIAMERPIKAPYKYKGYTCQRGGSVE